MKDALQVFTLRFNKWCSANNIRLGVGDLCGLAVYHGLALKLGSSRFSIIQNKRGVLRHAQPYITPGLFHYKGVPAELRLKAYGSRVMVAYFAVALKALAKTLADPDQSLILTLACCQCISDWQLALEEYPIKLNEVQARHLWDEGNKCQAKHKDFVLPNLFFYDRSAIVCAF